MSAAEFSWDRTYLRMLNIMAGMGTCGRNKVAAIITQNRRIISTGINGPLSTDRLCIHSCDLSKTCEHAIHAEANAISAAAKEGISLDGATLYCNYSPCMKCAELIIQSGIKRVVFEEEYRVTAPLGRLMNAGVSSELHGKITI